MAYKLTLTKSERDAIDWVGHRYFHGNELYSLLLGKSTTEPEEADWDSDCDITFRVPENIAWEIADGAAQEDTQWTCFAPDLASKMQAFVDAIV